MKGEACEGCRALGEKAANYQRVGVELVGQRLKVLVASRGFLNEVDALLMRDNPDYDEAFTVVLPQLANELRFALDEISRQDTKSMTGVAGGTCRRCAKETECARCEGGGEC